MWGSVRGACFRGLLSKTLRSWSREVLHVAKTKTIRRWELNTSDICMNLRAEDFFVGRCRNNIYTM